MAKLSRQYTFKNGQKANANEVNDELNHIHSIVNGKLASDNLADGGITKTKLAFALASDKYLGEVPTYNDLATTFTNPRDNDIAIVDDEKAEYIYNLSKTKWEKISGTVATTTHNQLDGRSLADAHPQSAITGLETRLTGIEGNVSTNATNISSNDTELADHESRVSSLETDTSTLRTDVNSNDTDILNLQNDKVNRVGNDSISGAFKIGGVGSTDTKFQINDATNGDIRIERSTDGTGLLIKQTNYVSMLQYQKGNTTTWGGWTHNGLQNFMKRITAEDGLTVSNPNWTGTTNVEILMNASDLSDNYGITLKSGGRLSDGKGVKLTIDPVKDALGFYGTDNVRHDVLHKGNANPSAYDTMYHERLSGADYTLAVATYEKVPFDGTNLADWDDTNEQFVAPKDGIFQFNLQLPITAVADLKVHALKIFKNGTNFLGFLDFDYSSGTRYQHHGLYVEKLIAGDTIHFEIYSEDGGNLRAGRFLQITQLH